MAPVQEAAPGLADPPKIVSSACVAPSRRNVVGKREIEGEQELGKTWRQRKYLHKGVERNMTVKNISGRWENGAEAPKNSSRQQRAGRPAEQKSEGVR